MVADIDQLLLMLSIPKMWNLERNIREFEPKSILTIISCNLMDIEKRYDESQVTRTSRSLDGIRVLALLIKQITVIMVFA